MSDFKWFRFDDLTSLVLVCNTLLTAWSDKSEKTIKICFTTSRRPHKSGTWRMFFCPRWLYVESILGFFLNNYFLICCFFWLLICHVFSAQSGAAAGLVCDIIFFPLDTLKTRLQSQHGFIKSGGFKKMYQGVAPVIIGSAPAGNPCFVEEPLFK